MAKIRYYQIEYMSEWKGRLTAIHVAEPSGQ